MHVDVIQLRYRGAKIPQSELEGPMRGHLRMARWRLHNKTEDRMTVTARLTAFGERNNPSLLPDLKEAMVVQVDQRGMVIVGLQSVNGQDYKQAWAVIPVTREA
jgi:hypothetical protein